MNYGVTERYLTIQNKDIVKYLMGLNCSHLSFIHRGFVGDSKMIVVKKPPECQLTLNRMYYKVTTTTSGIRVNRPKVVLNGDVLSTIGASNCDREDNEVFRFLIKGNDVDVKITRDSVSASSSFIQNNGIDTSNGVYALIHPMTYEYYLSYKMIIIRISSKKTRDGVIAKKMYYNNNKDVYTIGKLFSRIISDFSINEIDVSSFQYVGFIKKDGDLIVSFKEG